jgi:hypothetical protein
MLEWLLEDESAPYQAPSHCYPASTTLLKVVAKHLESYLKRQGCQDTKRRAPLLFPSPKAPLLSFFVLSQSLELNGSNSLNPGFPQEVALELPHFDT